MLTPARATCSAADRSTSPRSVTPTLFCPCTFYGYAPTPWQANRYHPEPMAIINQATKELQVKIVFYGPAKSGKTTNLEQVHANVQVPNPDAKGKMTSLATSSDRTLFFDFFPLEAVAIKGFKTKFALFTVPGQVIYNATRQIVLRGVDGIVFVADSQYDKMEENI